MKGEGKRSSAWISLLIAGKHDGGHGMEHDGTHAEGGARGGGGALGGRDLRGGRGNVANGEFRVIHVRSDLQHADFLTKPLHREAFCVHRNFVMNIP